MDVITYALLRKIEQNGSSGAPGLVFCCKEKLTFIKNSFIIYT